MRYYIELSLISHLDKFSHYSELLVEGGLIQSIPKLVVNLCQTSKMCYMHWFTQELNSAHAELTYSKLFFLENVGKAPIITSVAIIYLNFGSIRWW